jgi:hypothetical protein
VRKYLDDIADFTELAEFFCLSQNEMLKEVKDLDIRVTVFSKLLHILNSTNLALTILSNAEEKGIMIKKGSSHEELKKSIIAYDAHIKQSLKLTFISAIEASFRQLLKVIDSSACSNGCDSFESIYNCLLKKINLQKFIPLLDLLRVVRNLIHNNGVYYHKNCKDEKLEYKG